MNNLKRIIKDRKFKVTEFPELIGMNYRTFKYQVDNGSMKYSTIKKILSILKCKFEDLENQEVKAEKKKYKAIDKS
jgi:DNA-binding Xre family transcriptional regulator